MNSYTHLLTPEQATKLRALLHELAFEFSPKQYTLFFAQKNKLSVAVYEKGPKVLVQDSKRIGSDARIRALAKIIRGAAGSIVDIVLIGPARYNELYEKFGNLNKLLGWGHARVIENLLAKKPDCPRALSDQFADARVVEQSLLRHARRIKIEQRPKAESDIAVAAASILAREAFINWLDREGKKLGMRLDRGVSPAVKSAAEKMVAAKGPEGLCPVRQGPFLYGAPASPH